MIAPFSRKVNEKKPILPLLIDYAFLSRYNIQVKREVCRIFRKIRRNGGCTVDKPQNYYVHPSACVDDGAQIGPGTKIWHFCHISAGSRIGGDCTIGQNVFVAPGVTIGKNCKIQNNVSVYEGVELGDYVFCGPSMVFTNVQRPRCKYPQRGSQYYVHTPIGEGASIGANATVVCGHRIGKNAFVAAGSVVTKDVPDHAIVMGNPARIRGWACECGAKLGEDLVCPHCGRTYVRGENGLKEETGPCKK